MKLVLDMASIIQTGMHVGVDKEAYEVEHDGKVVKINTAAHAYEKAMDYMAYLLERFELAPSDMIMVFEGRDSKKKRLQIAPSYKSNRDKSAPEYYREYNQAKETIKSSWRSVGAMAVTQDYAEGDDTCKYLSQILGEDVIVGSNDGDLSVFVGKTASGHTVRTFNGTEFDKLPGNVIEPRHLTLYKALVGDSKDSVKGVYLFGDTMWLKMHATYGSDGLDEIAEALDKNKVDTVAQYARQHNCKILTKIVDNWNDALTCWRLVKIYPEWVNTRYYPLKVEGGICVDFRSQNRLSYVSDLQMRPDERLLPHMQKKKLVTAGNFEECYKLLQERLQAEGNHPISFDIETSTDIESDDWMEDQGDPDGVDPIGSYLAGFSITFGKGGKRTFYVSVKHYETDNVTMSQARALIELTFPYIKPIHNSAFELPVLFNAKDEDGTLWRDHWFDMGEFGMMPNIEDTLLMSSYVDENAMQRNLKALSRNHLGYAQTEFNDMRTFRVGEDGSKPYPGGRISTRIEKKPVLDDLGRQVYTDKGKPKMETVKVSVPVFKEDGTPDTKRSRNKETGLMETVQKTRKVPKTYEEVRYKMHEMPATAVFDYGCDDTICTSGYYNFAKFMMTLDEHYGVYRTVEINAAYLHAKNYTDGFVLGHAELAEMKRDDAAVREDAEKVFHSYLVSKGWKGTVQPTYTKDITPAQIKEAYSIVFGLEEEDETEEEEGAEVEGKDPVMSMRIRKMDKIVSLIEDQDRPGADVFAAHLEKLLAGNEKAFNDYVAGFFDGKPKFAYGNKDKANLLYNIMAVPVKVRGDVTPAMRAAGIREGNPSADGLAVAYAIYDLTFEGRTEEAKVLEALKLITMVNQRESLYYKPYPLFVHWKTGRVHSSHRQCHANTRRASSAKPNMQQASAHEKIEGFEPRVRAAYQPHKRRAVIVSMDFNAQELRLIADDSQDPNMLACYVGDSKKDMHSITGSMIALSKSDIMKAVVEEFRVKYANEDDAVYYAFVSLAKSEDKSHVKVYKEYRSLGKKVNFTALYGAMAEKIAVTLMVSLDDAQLFLDARAKAFRVSEEWKVGTIVAFAKENGYVLSRLGARRHLAEMFDSTDRRVSSKAERQAANFRIQGSAAEMTKMAEGRMWRAGLFSGKYDAVCLGPIHDEVVASVVLEDLPAFLKEMHACMTEPYADMKVEVMSSIEFGPNMMDLIEIGMEPTDEAITKGIADLREQFPQLFGLETA